MDKSRLKWETKAWKKYNKLQKKQKNVWIILEPIKELNYDMWAGKVRHLSNKKIKFEARVVFLPEYPAEMPALYLEGKILNYCGKMYIKTSFTEESGEKFYMAALDAVTDLSFWDDTMDLSHFLERAAFPWWKAQQDVIESSYNEKK